nr:MAG TPA: hypothetical protein [Bacteriophage sp.]
MKLLLVIMDRFILHLSLLVHSIVYQSHHLTKMI